LVIKSIKQVFVNHCETDPDCPFESVNEFDELVRWQADKLDQRPARQAVGFDERHQMALEIYRNNQIKQ
jgi:hypothetical protein